MPSHRNPTQKKKPTSESSPYCVSWAYDKLDQLSLAVETDIFLGIVTEYYFPIVSAD